MASVHDQPREGAASPVFAGGGEMGALMRAFDWAATPLGPVEGWPQALRTCVRLLLTSRQPMCLGWGEELTFLYNDPYRAILGGKHPWALGRPSAEVWREIWADLAPRLASTLRGEEGTYDEALRLIMERHGYAEETYYTFSYSPIPDDAGRVAGFFCANTDDTRRVIGERQMALLRELAAEAAQARTMADACALSLRGLGTNRHDLPFAVLYLLDPDQRRAILGGTSQLARGGPAAPEVVVLDDVAGWLLAEVVRTNAPRLIADLTPFGPLPAGAWERPPAQAVALPVLAPGQAGPAAILIAGLNPYRLFDDDYRGFLDLVAGQIGTAVVNARAYEEERRRAEALAELDRAKTAFFSNVSHEFRTPLTLLLGPLADVLSAPPETPLSAERPPLEIAQRNALRLLRLVNTLLDFARVEGSRMEATYEPADLAALTAELAGVFRSAVERAGLRLEVDCSPLPQPVYVDHEMWEKVVLNLISNAFKFTFAGTITVALNAVDDHAELTVRDTGVGIPPEELPHLFERFHRVRGARARTHEGTGIGLALVRELVTLHGGSIDVESALDAGTTVTVTIPLGAAHLPAERIGTARTQASTALGAAPFVEEALRWLPDAEAAEAVEVETPTSAAASPGTEAPAARVLLADDNADMRAYVRRLLGARYDIEAVADGAAALAAARAQTPDLVLADVMMPGLDGFALLQALRADSHTRNVPVILLSARAGQEAIAEGLRAGADDYMVKPFAASELLARVQAHVALARLRQEASVTLTAERDRWRQVLDLLPVGVVIVDAQGRVEVLNQAGREIVGIDTRGQPLPAAGDEGRDDYRVHRPDGTPYPPEEVPLSRSLRHGEEVRGDQQLHRHAVTGRETPLLVNSAPLRDAEGTIRGAVAVFQDITELRELERTREEFLSSAAHDLKTPLTSIRGQAQLAQRRLDRLGRVELAPVAETLAGIQERVDAMVNLVDELVDVTRMEMGSALELRREPADLVALVRRGVGAQRAASGRTIHLETETPELEADVDAARIERVIGNLLSNAVKYSPRGAIWVRVAREHGSEGPAALIAVRDEGIGIPVADLPHIFERFARARNVAGHIQGTGIGLASARGIVEQHGGTITAESVEGQGATFTVRLPLIVA